MATQNKKNKPILSKRAIVIGSVAFWSVLFGIGLSVYIFISMISAGRFGELPTFEQLENPESFLASHVYSADSVLLGKYYSQNRTIATYENLPPNLLNALLATEDIRFYEHAGVDFRALARVSWGIITGNRGAGGGSTISQQLAKNLFPRENLDTSFKMVVRKIKEWIIATRLERYYTKDEILSMYLNTVEFSDNAFGILSATQTYFSKPTDSLKVEEAAVLVGMLQAPYRFNPRLFPERSKVRRNTVIGQMRNYGYLSSVEADSLMTLPITLNFRRASHIEGLAPHFREVLRLELQRWLSENRRIDGTAYNLYRDGLTIYTTIDSRMQSHAENAVQTHMPSLQKDFFNHWRNRDPWQNYQTEFMNVVRRTDTYRSLSTEGYDEQEILKKMNEPKPMKVFSYNGDIDTTMSSLDSLRYHRMFLQTGFMAMDPKSGHIKAWVGGINYRRFQFDHVNVNTKRQIGSTFKPFLYTVAVSNGWSPCFEIYDVPVTFEDFNNWTPTNSDGRYSGELYNLYKCLAQSKNTCSAYLMKEIGPQPVINLVRRMGIVSSIEPYPSIALGSSDISLFEMVGSYTAYANKGLYTRPIFIQRIEDNNGTVIGNFPTENTEVMSEETAHIMVEMLKNAVNSGTGMRLRFRYGLQNEIGGKTGTTQNNSDGWFIGITPELIAGTWVGGSDRFMRFRSIALGQGANMALPIWAKFFKSVYDDESLDVDYEAKFEPPLRPLTIELDCSKYQRPSRPDDIWDTTGGF